MMESRSFVFFCTGFRLLCCSTRTVYDSSEEASRAALREESNQMFVWHRCLIIG